tara:strand:- start:981 stop:2105 length:1125 start_codon:yes stop_codon:yes gene_type:complete
MKYIDSYNNNDYIKILKLLQDKMAVIENFITSIGQNNNFKEIDDLEKFYNDIFNQQVIKKHIVCKISQIYKPLYLSNPGPHSKGNAYFHLTLKLDSKEINWLDNLYNNVLSRFVRFYKHLFSKIDNYFISINSSQLENYHQVFEKIKDEIKIFIDTVDKRVILSKRQQLKTELLTKIPFGGLFYITHLDNVASILKLGILSHNLAHTNGFISTDISNQQVNARRNRIDPNLGGNIHDYTPLYFNHKNPMLYTLCKNTDRNKLILLKVNPHILLAENVSFSDGNASVRSTKFYKTIDEFNNLNWNLLNKGSWYNYEFGIQEGRRIMCSEVLAKEKIPSYYINEIFVYSEETLEQVLPMFPNHFGIKTNINKGLYF